MAKTDGGLGDEWIDESWLRLRQSAIWRFNRILLLYFVAAWFIPRGLGGELVWSVLLIVWLCGNFLILLRLLSRLARRLGLTSAPAETEVTVSNRNAPGPDIAKPRATSFWDIVERASWVVPILSALLSIGGWLRGYWPAP